ncbi:MAG: GTP 3',8-cyclase MoaA [Lentisphaerae bacterium]|jgi:GTP 3',8-cyclase|nr:GTP 3',8-cyclase MoaA [Lentisphaerota bacterium]MBT4821726.1 GTP 3',8-cyclase MoaA [Lentisphaerota bacterium]MBT5608830.1 GTP 3',8-cyclase MoaA [Lentisphaerota bacterium]MBT7061514.1 GTP 3',8-cyclase MoaA [Lentisphaerota bacterium]MBT7843361.1 GTP 3',8-cyclase MoaA [Lentisphaerota bacterium]
MIAFRHQTLLQELSLRLSVTDHCQMRCRYCVPSLDGDMCRQTNILTYEEIVTLVRCLQERFDLRKLRITGGEPLVRPGLERLIGEVSALGIPDLALTTNGIRLPQLARTLKKAGLRRVNISLDSLSPDTFRSLTGSAALRQVIEGIDAALACDLRPVKLNMVVVGGVNDAEAGELLDFALRRGCELRFIELMPIGPGRRLFETGFVSSEALRLQLEKTFEFSALETTLGSSARRYRVSGAGACTGSAGFISACSNPFCHDCTRLRVTADGRLLGCLARQSGYGVRELLKSPDPAAIERVVRRAFSEKRSDLTFTQHTAMASIGG